MELSIKEGNNLNSNNNYKKLNNLKLMIKRN